MNADNSWKLRYTLAHRSWQLKNTPNAVKDHNYVPTKFPDTNKANGLTLFIVNFLNWSGHRAKRINVMGRKVDKVVTEKTSGNKFHVSHYIKAANRGDADVSSTINGRSVKLEIKTGNDQPRPDQLKEQARERAAGGVYEFIHGPEEFFVIYDKIKSGNI